MPLVQSQLQQDLASAWRQPTDSCAVAAGRVAKAYADFAKSALSCGGGSPVPASILAAQQVLRTQLTAAYQSSGFNELTMAQKFSSALGLFWMGPPIAFVGGATPGVVTVALTPTLYADLVGVVENLTAACRQLPGPSVDYAAQQWSTALATWTHSVVVTHAPPSTCAGPIS